MRLASACPSCPLRLRVLLHRSILKEADMRPFEYTSPKTKDQVPALLGARWGETEVLAGGTDLLSLMKDEVTAPNRLVNIKGIQDLHGVSNAATGLRIGALMTLAEIGANADVTRQYPDLAFAAGA